MKTIFRKLHTIKELSALFVAALTISVALCGCSSSSAENVAKKAAQAYVDENASAYCKLLAPGYIDYIVGNDGWYNTTDEFKEDVIQDDMDELKNKFVKRYGENYSVEVSVLNVKSVEDEKTLERVQKELINDYNYEEGDIKDAAKVEIRFRCKGNNTGGDIYHTTYCVKVGGSWYIHRPDINALS